jgi:hypothetical protein
MAEPGLYTFYFAVVIYFIIWVGVGGGIVLLITLFELCDQISMFWSAD